MTQRTNEPTLDAVAATSELIDKTLTALDRGDADAYAEGVVKLSTMRVLFDRFAQAVEGKAQSSDRAASLLSIEPSLTAEQISDIYRQDVDKVRRLVGAFERAREKGDTNETDGLSPILSEINALTAPFAKQEAHR